MERATALGFSLLLMAIVALGLCVSKPSSQLAATVAIVLAVLMFASLTGTFLAGADDETKRDN